MAPWTKTVLCLELIAGRSQKGHRINMQTAQKIDRTGSKTLRSAGPVRANLLSWGSRPVSPMRCGRPRTSFCIERFHRRRNRSMSTVIYFIAFHRCRSDMKLSPHLHRGFAIWLERHEALGSCVLLCLFELAKRSSRGLFSFITLGTYYTSRFVGSILGGFLMSFIQLKTEKYFLSTRSKRSSARSPYSTILQFKCTWGSFRFKQQKTV